MRERIACSIKRPEVLFLIVSAVMAISVSIIMPPLSHSDPGYHLSKSYLMFSALDETPEELRLIPPDIKESIIEQSDLLDKPLTIDDGFSINLDKSAKLWRYDFRGGHIAVDDKVGISDLSHLPQAIGIVLARMILGSPSYNQIYYSGCFFNWLVCSLLIFLAIKIVPKYKWAFFSLATIPTILFLSCGLGYDALTNSVAFLFIAVVFGLYTQKKAMTCEQLLILTFLCIGAVLTKQTNVLLLLFIPFLPLVVYREFRPFRSLRSAWSRLSRRSKRIIITTVVVFCVVCGILLANELTYKLATGLGTTRINALWMTFKDLFRSIFRQDLAQQYNPQWLRSGPDGVLKSIFSYKSNMPNWILLFYCFGILLVIIEATKDVEWKTIKRLAIVSTSIFVVITFAIYLGMMISYLDFTIQTGLIDGPQGRYFTAYLPLLIPGVVAMVYRLRLKIAISQKSTMLLCVVMAVVANALYLYTMQAAYFHNLYDPLFF